MKKIIIILLFITQSLIGQIATQPISIGIYASGGTDTISIVIVGTQTWMRYNLNVSKFSDDTDIENITNYTTFMATSTPAWCYYDNMEENGAVYGKLYNWYAVNDAKGLCPVGFHVPTKTEWETLVTYLGGRYVAGGRLKEVGYEHWSYPNYTDGINSGFIALPGGYVSSTGFIGITELLLMWTNSAYNTNSAYFVYMVNTSQDAATTFVNGKHGGLSVRCIKDE
jgi:uncharacterized protein (TIGR02145 family)